MYFKLKPSLRIYDFFDIDNSIIIGKNIPISTTLEIDSREFLEILKLLDGNNSVLDISKKLELDESYLLDILNMLSNEYHIIDKLKENKLIREKEYEYYKKQMYYYEILPTTYKKDPDEIQYQLKESKVTILGCGGTGTNILRDLAGIGIGTINIVDFDYVEISNISRQCLFNMNDIGRKKVNVAKEKIALINPFIKVNAIDKKINGIEDLSNDLLNVDFLVVAADKPLSLINWVNEVCVKEKIPFLNLGLTEFNGIIGPLVSPQNTACFECLNIIANKRNEYREKIIDQIENYKFPWEEAAHLSMIRFLSSIASFEILNFLIEKQSNLENKTLIFNPYEFSVTEEVWHKVSNCNICSI